MMSERVRMLAPSTVMAMGTPVIASEVGGLAYLVRDGETGFHVPSRNPEALAERIFELLKDHALREQLGRNARLNARQYAWPLIVDQMVDLFDHLKTYKSAAVCETAPL